jgi:general secretion pathway protein G
MVRMQRTARNVGFTLIELMLVLVILATLAGLVAPKFVGQGKEAKIKATKVQISNFETALDAFEIAVGRYPTAAEGLRVLVVKPTTDPGDWERPFMKNIPLDPWSNEYQYVYPGQHNVDSYDLYSFGPDGKMGGGDDIVNWEEDTTRTN